MSHDPQAAPGALPLAGQRALVVGIANAQSIAWGCAQAFRAAGAEVGVTWLNARAEPHVRPLAERIGATALGPYDVRDPMQHAALFARIEALWGGLDIVLHAIAFCPKEDLQGRVVDCSAAGFSEAMDVSVHSFLRLIRSAEPLMTRGGCCLTVSFQGAGRVVAHYNVMGPVKAALESVTRYAAAELGPRGIRVNALSPGPLQTRAASGLAAFDQMLAEAAARAPTHQLARIEDIGAYAVFLASEAARNVTGAVHPIDGGYGILG